MDKTMNTDTPPSMPCPDCRGTGTVSVAVQWSDGLGMSSARCDLCLGAKTFPARHAADLVHILAAALIAERRYHNGVQEALDRLRTATLCYLVTSGKMPGVATAIDGTPIVPGFPGASPHVDTWEKAMRSAVEPWARTRQAQHVDGQRLDHEAGHHERPVPAHACNATNSRATCPLCQRPAMTPARLQDIVTESMADAHAEAEAVGRDSGKGHNHNVLGCGKCLDLIDEVNWRRSAAAAVAGVAIDELHDAGMRGRAMSLRADLASAVEGRRRGRLL